MNERLKQFRKSIGLNQTEFAEKLGLIQATYSSYESGKYRVPDKVIKSVCAIYHVSEDWLRTGEGYPEQEQTDEERFVASVADLLKDAGEDRKQLAMNVFHLLQEIPDEYLQCVLDFSRSLADARKAKKDENK